MFEFLEDEQLDELNSILPDVTAEASEIGIDMKYLDEYRDRGRGQKLAGGHRPHRHAALDHHGSLRRADAHHRQIRHR